ncbi:MULTISPECIES: DUF3493 domain-containing protein [unclassified Synechococcus]|nr:DUF3493 domain-containing protein [Synechococcus sp. Cruz-7B9]MCP9855731.1 DUF3493 domain-containing protein [Synechococcus sp. Cruz-9C9]MCP9863169.1 DUF3493 domain-containing protein [Synechococcus sp. Cruz-7E5]
MPSPRPKPQSRSTPLDPELRERLLAEAKAPWKGLRRVLWFAFAASGAIGLATMAMRASAGSEVASGDLLIQLSACIGFGLLIWRDR